MCPQAPLITYKNPPHFLYHRGSHQSYIIVAYIRETTYVYASLAIFTFFGLIFLASSFPQSPPHPVHDTYSLVHVQEQNSLV